MAAEFTIPGTGTKIPVTLALGGALAVAVLVIVQRGKGAETEPDTSGLLAAELDQRLQEQWQGLVQIINDALTAQGATDPTTPPSQPVTPRTPRLSGLINGAIRYPATGLPITIGNNPGNNPPAASTQRATPRISEMRSAPVQQTTPRVSVMAAPVIESSAAPRIVSLTAPKAVGGSYLYNLASHELR